MSEQDTTDRKNAPIVRLPRSEQPPRAEVPARANEDRKELSILIADDEPDFLLSESLVLHSMGYEIHTARSGAEALQVAAAQQPDAALLDIVLGDMSGYEVARRIRAEKWGEDMVLIAHTGRGQERDRIRSRDAGFDHHLVKPVDPRELRRLLETIKRATPAAKHRR